MRVVRKMYAMRFSEEAPTRQSIDQLRRIEGARVREMYKALRAEPPYPLLPLRLRRGIPSNEARERAPEPSPAVAQLGVLRNPGSN